MKRLPNGITRCAGKRCPDREQCSRYLQLAQDVAQHPNARVVRYRVVVSLRRAGDCLYRIGEAA